jgi:hypothetical protein
MRSPWCIAVPLEETKTHRETQGGARWRQRQERCSHKPREAWSCQEPERRQGPSPKPSEGARLLAQNCEKGHFCHFGSWSPWSFVTAVWKMKTPPLRCSEAMATTAAQMPHPTPRHNHPSLWPEDLPPSLPTGSGSSRKQLGSHSGLEAGVLRIKVS